MTLNYRSLIIAILTTLAGCTSPYFLPKSGELGESLYGSYIVITTMNNSKYSGELISVDKDQVLILPVTKIQAVANIQEIPIRDILKYRVNFARRKNFLVSNLIVLGSMPFQGLFLILTIPVNVISLIVINAGSKNEVHFNHKMVNISDLHKFARFPHGIPIDLERSLILPPMKPDKKKK